MPAAEGDTSTGGALASAADIVVRVHRRRVRVKKRKKKGKSRQVTFNFNLQLLFEQMLFAAVEFASARSAIAVHIIHTFSGSSEQAIELLVYTL
jgi:hypothetical protein